MNKINGINHFALVVGDLDKSCTFYTNILGLKLVKKREHDAFLDAGDNCVIGLLQYPGGQDKFDDEYRPKKSGKAFTHFGLQAKSETDVFEMEKYLRSKNVCVLKHAYSRWDGASVYFLDPNNYTLEYLYYKDNG